MLPGTGIQQGGFGYVGPRYWMHAYTINAVLACTVDILREIFSQLDQALMPLWHNILLWRLASRLKIQPKNLKIKLLGSFL